MSNKQRACLKNKYLHNYRDKSKVIYCKYLRFFSDIYSIYFELSLIFKYEMILFIFENISGIIVKFDKRLE